MRLRDVLRFRRLEAGAYRGAPPGQPLAVRVRGRGVKEVWLRPGTSDVFVLSETLFQGHHHPPEELQESAVRTVLDLGANIGLSAADFASRYSGARVLGVELDQGNAELAHRNVRPWSDRVEIVHGAAWIEDGEVHYAKEPGEEWRFRVLTDANGDAGALVAPAFTIERLIERLAPSGEVDYLKMDVEGAERELVRDAAAWAPRVRTISVEVHEPYTMEAARAGLEAVGFAVRRHMGHRSCLLGVRRSPTAPEAPVTGRSSER